MDLSIIIVNYNTCKLTLDAIESIYRSETNYHYEVIVVDNHSKDSSVERIKSSFPEVILIENKENVGFAKANNQGIKISQGRYILLLNSDTVIEKNTISTMLDFMNTNPQVGASGCKVLLPDGSLDKACRRGFPTPSASLYYMLGLSKIFPNNPKFNQYHLSYLDTNHSYEIDCLVGAFMVVRRSVIDQVGMLDEDFFMYGEDIDWCYRIKQAGWQIYYVATTRIMHYKGASSKKKPFKIIYEFHRAMYIFHKKHYHKQYNQLVNLLVYFGISLKFLLVLFKNQLKIR